MHQEQREAGTFTVTRDVDVEPRRAWEAWSDPALVQRWWGPEGWSAPMVRMDLRVGGVSLVSMAGDAGPEIFTTWTATRVEPYAVLEFDLRFADADGATVPPSHYGLPAEVPPVVHHVVTFEPLADGRTRVAVAESGYEPGPALDMSRAGQEQVMDRYAAVLAAG